MKILFSITNEFYLRRTLKWILHPQKAFWSTTPVNVFTGNVSIGNDIAVLIRQGTGLTNPQNILSYTSSDCIEWTPHSYSPNFITNFRTALFANGIFFLVNDSLTQSLTSDDGANWQPNALTNSKLDTPLSFFAHNNRFYMVASDNTIWPPENHIFESTDGKHFIYIGIFPSYIYDNISYDIRQFQFGLSINEKFLALGHAYYPDGRIIAIFSDNMIDWNISMLEESDSEYSIRSVVAANGQFFAFLEERIYPGANIKVISSSDGQHWEHRSTISNTLLPSGSRFFRYGDGLFVGVNWWGNSVYSTDGVNWTIMGNIPVENINNANIGDSLQFGLGKFFVPFIYNPDSDGENRYLMTSTFCSHDFDELLDTDFCITINSGADASFMLPTSGYLNGTGNYYAWIVDWGDGIISKHHGGMGTITSGIIHNYPSINTDYIIKIFPQNPKELGWLRAFGFGPTFDNMANRNKLYLVNGELTEQMIRTSIYDTHVCSFMFYNCQNLKMGSEFQLSPKITGSVGDNFCYQMFYNCLSLTMNDVFNLPQGITSVGNSFCQSMFHSCNSLTMNDVFNLPQEITGSVGNNFCYQIFYMCRFSTMNNVFNLPPGITSVGDNFANYILPSQVLTLNDVFNLPQGITDVGDGFCQSMFRGLRAMNDVLNLPPGITSVGNQFCSYMFNNLQTMNEVFNLPQGITDTNNYFCLEMFSGCTSLAMNNVFTLPQGITSVGGYIFHQMFYNCTSLTMNEVFNLPQGITGFVNNNVFSGMFYGCTSLTMNEVFNFPQGITSTGNSFCRSMFYNCTSLTMNEVFTLPQGITGSVGNLCFSEMFYGCSSLTMNEVFNFPPDITTVSTNFCQYMFYNCISLTMNEVFNLPQKFISIAQAVFCDRMFYGCTSLTMNSVFNLPQGITNISSVSGSTFCQSMFYGCTFLTMNDVFNLPPGITSVPNDFCRTMFSGCTNLTMNEIFNLPPGITSFGNNICYQMFYNCSSLTMNGVFQLPQGITSVGTEFCRSMFYNCKSLTIGVIQFFGNIVLNQTLINQTNVYYMTFYGCSNLTEPLADIPQLQLIPPDRRSTFYGAPSALIAPLHANWK